MLPSLTRLALAITLLSSPSLARARDTFSTDPVAYGATSQSPYQTYISAPELKPPQLLFTKNEGGLADGYVFIGVDGKPDSTQNVPCIFDMSPGPRLGTLVWTGIDLIQPFDFRVQTYKGKPHLTLFLGTLLNGYGHGSYFILNQSYVEVARFDAVGYPGLGDLHELVITEDDHAIVCVYTPKQVDLTGVGGPSDGWIFENIFQEINIETKEVVFSWNATDHVALTESYNTLAGVGTEAAPWDYIHINSVERDLNGDYLVSARVMNCVYKISGKDGSIIWRLGGMLSDFVVDPAAGFANAHDARWIDEKKQDQMTLFDNGPSASFNYSRGLLMGVNQEAKTVRLITEFRNGPSTFGQYEGNLQAINPADADTNFMIGFGLQPFFTEFSSNGTILLDAQFGTATVVNNYRTYKLPWQGKPLTKPDISWDSSSGKVHLSWNGATDHENWILYTADSIDSPRWTNISAPVFRTGFETEIDISETNHSSLVRAKAIDVDGDKLAWTDASDGSGNYFQAFDPEDSQLVNSDAESAATGVSLTSTATSGATSTSAAAASSTSTGAASDVMKPSSIIFALEILVIGATFVGL